MADDIVQDDLDFGATIPPQEEEIGDDNNSEIVLESDDDDVEVEEVEEVEAVVEAPKAPAKKRKPRKVVRENKTYHISVTLVDELTDYVSSKKTVRDEYGKRVKITESEIVEEGLKWALKRRKRQDAKAGKSA